MIRFLILLAVLAITSSSAPAAVVAKQRAPALLAPPRAVVVSALPEPQSGSADSALASCPYHFASDMPAATFCVYEGVVFDGGGEVCATNVVVLWSSLATPALGTVAGAVKPPASSRDVYLGFVADPELVVRAVVEPRRSNRAEVVEYTLGDEEVPQPLAGKMTLRRGSRETASVLSIELREPPHLRPGSCAVASYSGTYLGMIRPSSETTTSAAPFVVPRQ